MARIMEVAGNYWPRSLTSPIAHSLIGEIRLLNMKQRERKNVTKSETLSPEQ